MMGKRSTGKRSLKTAARAGAAAAVTGVVAERAKQTASSSRAAIAATAASTGQAAQRIAGSSGATIAATAASTGRAAKELGKRMSSRFAATVRTAASDEDAVWADRGPGGHQAEPTPSRDDALANLAEETARAQQAKATAAKAAFDAGAEVSEIARAAGERRHTIRAWMAHD